MLLIAGGTGAAMFYAAPALLGASIVGTAAGAAVSVGGSIGVSRPLRVGLNKIESLGADKRAAKNRTKENQAKQGIIEEFFANKDKSRAQLAAVSSNVLRDLTNDQARKSLSPYAVEGSRSADLPSSREALGKAREELYYR